MINGFRKAHLFCKTIGVFVALTVLISAFSYYCIDQGAVSFASMVDQPLTEMLSLAKPHLSTRASDLPVMRGMVLNPESPFDVQFFFDSMHQSKTSNKDISRLLRYFLGFLGHKNHMTVYARVKNI